MKQRDTTKIILVISVILLLVGMAAAAWYVNGRFTQLEEQNTALIEQQDTPDASETTQDNGISLDAREPNSQSAQSSPDREIITGQAAQESAEADVRIECYVFSDTVQEVWLRYGDTLIPQEQTSREPVETDTAEEDLYGRVIVTLSRNSIEPGKIYTYRCAGSASGDSVQGGTASFTSLRPNN